MMILWFILFPTATWAFQPLPVIISRRLALRAVSNTNQDVIRRLRQEYRDLQDELFVYLTYNDRDSAHELSEEMLSKAADLNTVERYNQVLKVKKSADELDHAKKDLESAKEMVSQAHSDALVADFKTYHVDSIDEVFDTAKHEKAVNAAKDARNAEEFAKEVLVDMQFEELQAEVDYDSAEALLQDLVENSKLLERTLDHIKYEHELAEHWAQQEIPKHRDFLSTARHVIRSGKLIDHDPTKGNVAF